MMARWIPDRFAKGKIMGIISRQYIADEYNRKVAVQIPIETFEELEEILENYALVQLMKNNEGDEPLSIDDAKSYDDRLDKAE